MRGMRNHVAHGYVETHYELVWDTVEELPGLTSNLSAIVGPFPD